MVKFQTISGCLSLSVLLGYIFWVNSLFHQFSSIMTYADLISLVYIFIISFLIAKIICVFSFLLMKLMRELHIQLALSKSSLLKNYCVLIFNFTIFFYLNYFHISSFIRLIVFFNLFAVFWVRCFSSLNFRVSFDFTMISSLIHELLRKWVPKSPNMGVFSYLS